MLSKVQSTTNFEACKYAGTNVSVSNRARRLLNSVGQDAAQAVDKFSREKSVNVDPTANMSWWEAIKYGFSKENKNNTLYFDNIKFDVRKGAKSSTGKPTLIMKFFRNISGKELGQSEREVDFYGLSRSAMDEMLASKADAAINVANTAHDAWAINSESFVREDLLQK